MNKKNISKKLECRIWLVIFASISLIYPSLVNAADKITSKPADYRDPIITEQYFVWEQPCQQNEDVGCTDIFVMNLSNGQASKVTQNPSRRFGKDISGTKLVWSDRSSGVMKLYLYDLVSKELKEISGLHNNSPMDPSIDGDKIVWVDHGYVDLRNEIHIFTISTNVEERITNKLNFKAKPDVSGDNVVWAEQGDIFLYNLKTKILQNLTSTIAEVSDNPKISGQRVVWQAEVNRLKTVIYYKDLSTGQTTPITSTTGEGIDIEPNIQGDTIVWLFTNDVESKVCKLSISKGVTEIASQTTRAIFPPSVTSNRISWIEGSNAVSQDIYTLSLATGVPVPPIIPSIISSPTPTPTPNPTPTPAPNNSPDITAIDDKRVVEGSTMTFNVTSSDPDQDKITLSAALSNGNALSTIGAKLTDNGNGTGVFDWVTKLNPGETVSTFPIVIKAKDSKGLEDTENVTITVDPKPVVLTCNQTGSNAFFGCYYNDVNLSVLKKTRTDSTINFNWNSTTPMPEITSQAFSVRWQGKFIFEAGDYDFTATADDGVRLYVDGVLVLDKWFEQAATKYTAKKTMTAGEHVIKVEYYQAGGPGSINVGWTKVVLPPAPAPLACDQVGQNNFFGCYYDNIDLTGLKKTRTDAGIHFNWGSGSPMPEIGVDTFSTRWQGKFTFASGTHQFVVKADDGVRFYIDGKLILDKWIDQAPTTYTVTQVMSAGEHVVKVEYFENGGGAEIDLSWKLVDVPPALSCNEIGVNTFVGCYYDDVERTQLKMVRKDASIAFNWRLDSPATNISPETFGVVWQGNFDLQAGLYTMNVRTDDGIRVYVDGKIILDKWINQVANYSLTTRLTAGKHLIKIEYYENAGSAEVTVNFNQSTRTSATRTTN